MQQHFTSPNPTHPSFTYALHISDLEAVTPGSQDGTGQACDVRAERCSLTQPAFFSHGVTERNKEKKEQEATKAWQNLEAQRQYFIAVGNVFRLSRRYLGRDLNSALCVVVRSLCVLGMKWL